jgi:hypothetical protein
MSETNKEPFINVYLRKQESVLHEMIRKFIDCESRMEFAQLVISEKDEMIKQIISEKDEMIKQTNTQKDEIVNQINSKNNILNDEIKEIQNRFDQQRQKLEELERNEHITQQILRERDTHKNNYDLVVSANNNMIKDYDELLSKYNALLDEKKDKPVETKSVNKTETKNVKKKPDKEDDWE